MSDRGLRRVRSRLWPTRRWFDIRQEKLDESLSELQAALAELAGAQQQLQAGQQQLLAEHVQLKAGQEQLLAGQRALLDWQAELRTRVRRAQALTARVYERQHDWPGQLRAAREHPDYELAYSDPDPLISIAVSTYHSPDTLCDRSLAAVRAQTHTNWEAIVVGDHCTDDTEARVQAIGDPRIRFYNLAVREVDPPDPWERWAVKGSVPRTTGVRLAKGRWIAPLSQDDAWDPDHLETLLRAAREHRAELVYSRMRGVGVGIDIGVTSYGAWPPRLGGFNCQSSMFNGSLRFLTLDRACALASEPNDWNLARRAWEAGVRFEFVDRETSSLYVYPRGEEMASAYAALGLPPSALAAP